MPAIWIGVSEQQVRNVLNLERKFAQMPVLKNQLVSGEVTVNKLIRIAAVATPENERFWAEQVEVLSKAAVEALVRDTKMLQIGLPGQLALPDSIIMSNIEVKASTAARLKELQSKEIDIEVLINETLDRREAEIAGEKARLAEALADKARSASAAHHEIAHSIDLKCLEARRR